MDDDGLFIKYICSLVKDDFMARSVQFVDIFGKPLSISACVAIALRRLGSGDSLSIVGDSLGVSQSTVAQITWRFVEAMEEKGLHHLRWPSCESEIEEVKSRFFEKTGLPNCCGVIDTTQIFMSSSSDIWCDGRNAYGSMILQAIVGPDMRFLDVAAGWPGSFSDSMVLRNSSFFELAEDSKRLNGKKVKISDQELGEYIVGDGCFPLLPWLLTPYNQEMISGSQIVLNKHISLAHDIAQSAFARLKDTFNIIQGIMWRPDKNRLPRIILVCCILHNILIDLEGKKLSVPHDSSWETNNSSVCKENYENCGLRETVCLHLPSRTFNP